MARYKKANTRPNKKPDATSGGQGSESSNEESVLESAEVLQERVLGAEALIEKNRHYVIGGFVVILVLIAGSFGYNYYKSQRVEKGQADIFYAQEAFKKDSLDLALNGSISGPGFIEIADKYAGTSIGDLADFYAGNIYLKKGEFDQAQTYLEGFSADDYLLTARAKSLLGDVYAEKEAFEKAAEAYYQATQTHPNKEMSALYFKKAALMYEMTGKKDKAVTLLKRFVTEYPKSSDIQNIKKELTRLTGKPQL